MPKSDNEKIFFERIKKINPKLLELLKRKKEKFSFRINRLKTTNEEIEKFLKNLNIEYEKVNWFEDVYILDIKDRDKIIKSNEYSQGKIYIQNLSSIFCALNIDLKENEWLLDMASAPGGKSLLWSSLLENRGKISAVEKDKNRFFMLKRNIKSYGVKNIKTYNKDGRAIGKICPNYFDKVLLDAPCSSESEFDFTKENPITYWNLRRVYRNSKLQKELIVSAWNSLKPGGILIYATCTFSPEENEEVVDFLLKKFENAKILDIDVPFENYQQGVTKWENKEYNKEIKKTVRILPKGAYSGFFMAKIEKI
ncbi:RsmB/NOP family class I SAM-dependent RNA methyltransferase [Nitrosophilus kaiyonis]|uniref:RsmB/NOP family class I SAM-dependent RNA methyltransferase n=1 Tax=Nitrosophilus kaiyonis TaxID=2930200 RepID=UPI002491DBCF|nr:RsmB/NOP family class I SAM-dependent RNA methyltransferase [Nitrosophilus kaiyonis]